MAKVARWAFTVNNPEAWRPVFDADTMEYLCYEIEHGAQGTEHVQGYVCFKGRKALATVKGKLCQEAHLEAAKGSEEQNRTYCNKEGGIVEYGTYEAARGSKQGHRTDLTSAIEKLKSGVPKTTVFMEHPELLIKYPAGMEKAAEMLLGAPELKRETHNTVLWGETGTGKSHRAHIGFPEAYFTTAAQKGTFDHYCGEKVVVLDEFDPLQIDIQQLLQWLDVWKVQLQCRYANKWARWTHLIICSNLNPDQWYVLAADALRQALRRRLTAPLGKVYNVKDKKDVIDLNWWVAPPASEPGSSRMPAMTEAAGAKRTTPPSRSSSPTTEPPLQRRRTGGAQVDSEIISIPMTMGTQGECPVYISDSEEESQSQ